MEKTSTDNAIVVQLPITEQVQPVWGKMRRKVHHAIILAFNLVMGWLAWSGQWLLAKTKIVAITDKVMDTARRLGIQDKIAALLEKEETKVLIRETIKLGKWIALKLIPAIITVTFFLYYLLCPFFNVTGSFLVNTSIVIVIPLSIMAQVSKKCKTIIWSFSFLAVLKVVELTVAFVITFYPLILPLQQNWSLFGEIISCVTNVHIHAVEQIINDLIFKNGLSIKEAFSKLGSIPGFMAKVGSEIMQGGNSVFAFFGLGKPLPNSEQVKEVFEIKYSGKHNFTLKANHTCLDNKLNEVLQEWNSVEFLRIFYFLETALGIYACLQVVYRGLKLSKHIYKKCPPTPPTLWFLYVKVILELVLKPYFWCIIAVPVVFAFNSILEVAFTELQLIAQNETIVFDSTLNTSFHTEKSGEVGAIFANLLIESYDHALEIKFAANYSSCFSNITLSFPSNWVYVFTLLGGVVGLCVSACEYWLKDKFLNYAMK